MAEPKTRKSRAQAKADREQLEDIEATRQKMLVQAKRAIKLRSKDREFHGLNREFQYAQAQIANDYSASRDIRHPRDVGTVREHLLRDHFIRSGFLPKRYGVSDASIRVASTSGHLSKELDIVFYDPVDSFLLMQRKGVFEVLPVESVYGAIQVKSRLSKKELASALDNIASFKKLNPAHTNAADFRGKQVSSRGFGIIFAYETEMAWLDIIKQLNEFAQSQPAIQWPNAIYILNVGLIALGNNPNICFHNGDLERLVSPSASGRPDQGDMLLAFQNVLMDLLCATHISPPPFSSYCELPLVAGDQSYRFGFGQFAEIGSCEKHGDYPRRIAGDKLAMISSWCRTTTPINWVRATDIAMGKPGDDDESYAKQPGDVLIYNPDGLPLSDILTYAGSPSSVAYQIVNTEGMSILLPNHYSAMQSVINECPACANDCKPKKPKSKAGTEKCT